MKKYIKTKPTNTKPKILEKASNIPKDAKIIMREHLISQTENLMAGFGIDEVQAEYIAEIRLRNLNKEFILKNVDNIDKITAEIAELNKLLSSDRTVKSKIAKQLAEIAKKYGQDRKTELIESNELVQYNEQEHIDDYPLTIFFTKEQYLKKVPASSLRSTTTEI